MNIDIDIIQLAFVRLSVTKAAKAGKRGSMIFISKLGKGRANSFARLPHLCKSLLIRRSLAALFAFDLEPINRHKKRVLSNIIDRITVLPENWLIHLNTRRDLKGN